MSNIAERVQDEINLRDDRIRKLEAENEKLSDDLFHERLNNIGKVHPCDDSTAATLAATLASLEAAEAKVEHYETLKQVVRWILQPDDRGPVFDRLGESNIDGGDIQDEYEKLGILIPITVTEPCCENCQCAEWDDFPQTCYRLADWMQNEAALQEPKHD